MNKLITLSLLCAVFMGVSARAQTQDTSATTKDSTLYGDLIVKVIDSKIKEPLPGAIVLLQKEDSVVVDTINKYTDISGKLVVRHIPLGRYFIKCKMMGFVRSTTACNIKKANKANKITISLVAQNDINRGGDPAVAKKVMIEPTRTRTVHTWTKEEIDKIPGH